MYKAVALVERRIVTEIKPPGYPGVIIYERRVEQYGTTTLEALNILMSEDETVTKAMIAWIE